ncbi:unnamed protein product [Rotaria sp. Silwood1]|nr:unnamed protein product [Rotaria sp. Silwood1]
MKELDQLRERYLIIGNRSLLDLIQITWIEHRDQAIVLGYLLKTSNIEGKIHRQKKLISTLENGTNTD